MPDYSNIDYPQKLEKKAFNPMNQVEFNRQFFSPQAIDERLRRKAEIAVEKEKALVPIKTQLFENTEMAREKFGWEKRSDITDKEIAGHKDVAGITAAPHHKLADIELLKFNEATGRGSGNDNSKAVIPGGLEDAGILPSKTSASIRDIGSPISIGGDVPKASEIFDPQAEEEARYKRRLRDQKSSGPFRHLFFANDLNPDISSFDEYINKMPSSMINKGVSVAAPLGQVYDIPRAQINPEVLAPTSASSTPVAPPVKPPIAVTTPSDNIQIELDKLRRKNIAEGRY